MATGQQIIRWIFGIRSPTVQRAFVFFAVCSTFIIFFMVIFTFIFENGSIYKRRFSQINLKSEIFLARIRNSYPLRRSNNSKELCPTVSPLLVGWADVSLVAYASRQESQETFNSRMSKAGLKLGGRYKPIDCQSRNKVAIVVPYRNRKFHLKLFLRYIHPFLQRQQLEYAIVVVEQSDDLPFNRGLLMNIGFTEAQKQDRFQCFIFHDVDLLPEDDGNTYACPQVGKPRQMAFSIDIYDYKPTPIDHFGGVSAFSTCDFQRVNGFSNVFFGWGSEDDDLYRRVLRHNLTVTRMFQNSFSTIGRYRMIDHPVAKPNPDRMRLFDQGTRRLKSDGLIDLKYRRLSIKLNPLYTHIIVDVIPQMRKTKIYQTRSDPKF